MPTIITHALTGYLSTTIFHFQNKKLHRRLLLGSLLCPVIPDLDVIAFAFGIPYGGFWGHRGFSHSLIFAVILAVIVVGLFFRKFNLASKQKFFLTSYFFILTASHGIFDAFTNGGLGVAFFAPFDNTRYFFPFTPIQVSPIGPHFFSSRGLRVLFSEMLWIWLPTLFFIIFLRNRILGELTENGRKKWSSCLSTLGTVIWHPGKTTIDEFPPKACGNDFIVSGI